MVLGSFWLKDSDKDDPELGKQHMRSYLLISAIISTGLIIPLLIFYKEAPKNYPSSAAKQQAVIKFDFKDNLR